MQKNNTYGCVKCANENRALHKTDTYETALNQFKEIYNDFYIYPINNKEIYKNKQSKIQIICPIHGEFIKSAQKHLSGQACFECKVEELVEKGLLPGGYSEQVFLENPELKLVNAYLYYLKINNGQYYKIGITKKHPNERIKSLKHKAKMFGEILEFELLSFKQTMLYEAYLEEQKILNMYADNRVYRK